MVLNRVIRPPRQESGDLSPSVAEALLGLANGKVLVCRPWLALDSWVQLVFETLPALFSTATWQLFSNHCPFAPPVYRHQLLDELILLRGAGQGKVAQKRGGGRAEDATQGSHMITGRQKSRAPCMGRLANRQWGHRGGTAMRTWHRRYTTPPWSRACATDRCSRPRRAARRPLTPPLKIWPATNGRPYGKVQFCGWGAAVSQPFRLREWFAAGFTGGKDPPFCMGFHPFGFPDLLFLRGL